jgi:DNA-binding response OmpR family regulator
MKALVVDDDRVLADVVAFTLRREGFNVALAYDGAQALERFKEEKPSIVILDVNIPKIDGFTVCERIREHSQVPILLLTVRGEEDDIVHGLEIGADDYIIKPFSPRQLVARMQAILRRAGQQPASKTIQLAGLKFNPGRHEVTVDDGEPISLTPLENRLFEYLVINAGQVLTMDSIIDYVWGPGRADRDMVRQLVHRLRSKIESDPSKPTYIQTVSGLGYGLKKIIH